MSAVIEGKADAGLIIHESRFTYQSYGLHKVLDLGEWWEKSTGLPLPLGGIAAKRSLGTAALARLSSLVRTSVEYARKHPAETLRYVHSHSQEMSGEVCSAHIALYVNDYSLDPGPEGERAAELLFAHGEQLGLFPHRVPLYSCPLQVVSTGNKVVRISGQTKLPQNTHNINMLQAIKPQFT